MTLRSATTHAVAATTFVVALQVLTWWNSPSGNYLLTGITSTIAIAAWTVAGIAHVLILYREHAMRARELGELAEIVTELLPATQLAKARRLRLRSVV
jgi:hypothetical protein